jgi:hypothetical protein
MATPLFSCLIVDNLFIFENKMFGSMRFVRIFAVPN